PDLCLGWFAITLEGDPQAVVDDGMIGQELQNIAVKPLRLGQPPSPMVGDGRLQLGLKLSSLWKDCHHIPPSNDKFMRTEFGNDDKFMGAEWEVRDSSFKMVPGVPPHRGSPRRAFGPLWCARPAIRGEHRGSAFGGGGSRIGSTWTLSRHGHGSSGRRQRHHAAPLSPAGL